MSGTKFTPGPWMVGKSIYQGKARVYAEKGGRIADVFAYEEDQVHANAVLIAVAPEMHEELNNICLMCQRGEIEVEYTSHRFHGDCKNCQIGKIPKKVG